MFRLFAAAALTLAAGAAQAADALTLQLRWLPQAQFAGYLVARDRGFYAAEGLDVTILPGGPGIVPAEALATGRADVAVDWMPPALAARESGLPVVNIAQPFARSGLMLVCRGDSGITDLRRDLPGRMVGSWFGGDDQALRAWLNNLGLSTEGADAVRLRDQAAGGAALLREKRADCVTAMSYDLPALSDLSGPVIFRAEDHGAASLEDGLYTLEQNLRDPAMAARLVRFVRATMKGWRHAEAHPEDAAAVLAAADPARPADRQRLEEVLRLTAGSSGALDPAAAGRTVQRLLAGGAGAVLSHPPERAWTDRITAAALK